MTKPNFKPDLSTASSVSAGKRVAANSSMMVGAKGVAAVMGFMTLTITAVALDSTLAFGTIMFLHAYMLFFSEVATFQAWQGIIRFGSDDVVNDDAPSLARLIKFGITLDFLSAIAAYVMAIALFSFFVFLGSQFPSLSRESSLSSGQLQNYVALYCIVILFRQLGTSIGVFRLFDKFRVLAVKALIMPITRLLGAIYAAHAGWGLDGFLCIWFGASLVSYIFLPVAAMLELKRRRFLGMVIRAKADFLSPRSGLWLFTIKSNIDSTLAAGHLHLPLLLVTAIFGPAFAGVYKIAEEAAKLLSEGFKLFDQVIYPEIAKMISAGDGSKIWRLVTRTAFILLSFGLFFSALILFVGPNALSALFGEDYAAAAPLASLLVPAAALLGIVAPLYPIYYATDCPEKAIYSRALSLIIFIVALFALSSTAVGQMAPGWAAIIGNVFAVVFVAITANRALKASLKSKKDTPYMAAKAADIQTIATPIVRFVGAVSDRVDICLWGLPLIEWQRRAFKKAGAAHTDIDNAVIALNIDWILSTALCRAFVGAGDTALVIDGEVIGVNGGYDHESVKRDSLIGMQADEDILRRHGLTAKSPEAISDIYNKALRKSEPPYALNITRTPLKTIMQRQFDSSYKGITDFVTKYFWPIPAFYVTRACAVMKLSPNMVTTIGLILCIAAFYFFMQGQWALGFVTGWIMTFLDTVDGKLARTTMTYSWWGNIYDHGIDLIHPPFWYYAWFIGLGGVLASPSAMTIALALIMVGYVVDRIIEGIFIAQRGFHIHVWRPFNSLLRIYTARRNPNTFIFMLAIIASLFVPEAGIWGFYAVAAWTWICIIINIGVVIKAAFTTKPVVSWMDGA